LSMRTIILAIGSVIILSACKNNVEPVVEDPAPGEETPAGMAIRDLSERLDIPTGKIELLGQKAVTWRDGSLGCPKPDMMYTQALVEGSQIILRAKGSDYAYHSGKGRPPFYCENPVSPASGSSAE
jgi:hypothetical protein